ncbi:U3 small nucleolar RNA-associated protein 10 [Fistulifera solaris]|uniref:HEAT repeat-containing protein 1 n=1 Tax=Fistulifera solaris TaxID=1519565 RepID=A0A1Z5KQ21_FISSO|nr:U3 small nucleolar RNA-associated protein 10 [Fistulifera solaris]|eukprot:GAX28202.1 U3 small nucleolar RNA-associated protein 10 [Fistulifera solaris]
MSLSTLQAQLAALSGRSKNPGSVYASSKKHDQAVGRGLHFSTQHGHSIQTKFAQPSLLAATAKEAADTPLQALTENCRIALTELSSTNPQEAQFWLNASRICNKDNVQYKVVQEVLVHLSASLRKISSVNASWHVLEYLLRRYELHVSHFEDLLWTLWPSADQYPAMFLRALKCIDLGEHPSYMWLRAYTTSETIPPRQQLSQHVMKHKDLLKKVCTWSNLVADLSGAAPVLSFTAAILVEGLAWTQKQGQEDLEGISKIIFQTVLSACEGASQEWKGWGWVISSVLVETMPLSSKYLGILTEKILEDSSSSAVMVVISLLSQHTTELSSDKRTHYLPLGNGSHLGCAVLPKDTREKLVQIPGLPSMLGELQREIVIAPFLASFLVGCLAHGNSGIVIEMIREKSLELFWIGDSEIDMVASLSSFIVHQVLTQIKGSLDSCKAVLDELHRFDPVACERGIGRGIQWGNGDQEGPADVNRKRLLSLLDGIIELTPTTEDPSERISLDILPARVGIEHADSAVRLQAIARLVRDDVQGDLLATFLRRWASEDDNQSVALAACNATIDCLQKDINQYSIEKEQALQWTLEACCFWAKEFSAKPSASGVKEILCKSVVAAGLLCGKLFAFHHYHQWKSIVQLIVAHIRCKENDVSILSQQSFVTACGRSVGLSGDLPRDAFDRALVEDMGKWMSIIPPHGIEKTERIMEFMFRHTSIALLIETITNSNDVGQGKESGDMVFRFCVELLKAPQPYHEVISKGLKWCIEKQEYSNLEIVKNLTTLCSAGSEEAFEEAVAPSIEKLLSSVSDDSNQPVSPLAVALEVATRSSVSSKASVRLLRLAKRMVEDKVDGPWLCLVPALSLIEQSDQRIREASKELLLVVAERMEFDSSEWKSVSLLCRSVLSSVTWTGESIVSRGLSACSGGEHFDDTRRKLLTLLFYTAIGIGNARCTSSSNNILRSTWLPCGAATGGETASSNLFKALETTSEEVLPLLIQWELFGRPIVDLWLGAGADYRIGKSCLVHVIVRILLEAHRSSSSLMIVSGPGHSGRRTRSYSFSKGDELPYPRDMLKSIIALLSIENASELVRSFAIAVVKGVVAQSSWQEHVYKNLPREDRSELSLSILKCVGNSAFMVPDEFFTNFPLDCTDVLHLVNVSKASMTSLILLADFIRVNATSLFVGANASELCKSLLMVLSDLHKEDVSNGREDLDRMDFALYSVLRAINEAIISSKSSIRFDKKDLQTLAKCISTILATNEAIDSPSSRTRLASQELLTSMCGLYPLESVPLLIPVILSAFESCEPTNKARQRQNLLSNLVPVYMQCARSARMTMHQLLGKVVRVIRKMKENDQKRVFYELSDAIATHCQHTSDKQFVDTNATIGTLVTEFIACVVHFKDDNDESLDADVVDLCLGMISRVPVVAQASSLLLLLHYVEALTAALQGESIESDLIPSDDTILPLVLDICSVPLGQGHDERNTFLKVAVGIMRTINEALNLQSIRKLLRRNNTESSFLSLQLWQNVLSLEARLHGLGTGFDGLRSLLSTLVDDCRDSMQDILPVPLFLASTMSVIREATSDQLRVNALRLIAERSLNLDPSSAEFSLFLDIIPEVSSLIGIDNTSSSQLQQGAFILVEHLARALPANYFGDKEKELCQKQFLELMARSVQAVQEQLAMITKNRHEFSTIDACCYSSLCGASLVRILGPKCLPLLPKFVKALNSILVISNSLCDELKSNIVTEIRLCQLATMRSILCITEAVPQFLPSYLGSLLKPDSLLAPCLYDIMSDEADCRTVISIRDRLRTALSTKIPPRSFVPAACKAMGGCSLLAKVAVLSMLKQSVEVMSHSECSGQVIPIFSAIVNAFESSFSCEDRLDLMQPGCELFLAVTMKISEVQLRKLFVLFKEWRGDFNAEDPETGAEKRYAYWFVCSHLSKALRGIFLPCLTITYTDAVSELEVATKVMCKATDAEKRGNKRRRVEDQGDLKYGVESIRSLQPLCLCLEYALTADAHQGGNWVRGDDNQKYESLLTPLGKLLQARVPMDFPLKTPDSSGFQSLVLGPALQSGSVIGSLKALACAGGNEQLWKPLNHAVLEACGNETRNEVKRAGLTCLLSLIESLGDEYLVLIPECLPVLSELLEDSDEDVAALAKDIVTLAEEMLGESLESSLR